jgi:hypothetical protein
MLNPILVWTRLVRSVIQGVRHDPEFRALFVAAVALLLVGTVFYAVQEDWSVIDALYFSTIVLTTVGLGDLAPTSALSKLFTIGYVLVGIGVILAFVDRLVREQREVRGPLRGRHAASRESPRQE